MREASHIDGNELSNVPIFVWQDMDTQSQYIALAQDQTSFREGIWTSWVGAEDTWDVGWIEETDEIHVRKHVLANWSGSESGAAR